MSGRRALPGAVAGLGAAALFGLSTPIAKRLLPFTGSFAMAGCLYLGAGLGLAVIGPFRRSGRESALRRADQPALAGMIAAGGIAGPVLLLAGLARLSGAQASLLLNLEAPFTMLLAVLAFGESLSTRDSAGALAIVAGGVALSWGPTGPAGQLGGVTAVAGACAAWALDNNLSQRLSLRDPVAVARVKSLVAGVVNVLLAVALGERLPRGLALAGALATGFLGYGLSIALHLLATRHVGAARQAAYFATAPFLGALASVPILGERLGAAELGAGALMALGLVLLARARHAHRHAHELLEHEHAHVHDEHHRHEHGERVEEPHSHPHRHERIEHDHPHLPDAHHRHGH